MDKKYLLNALKLLLTFGAFLVGTRIDDIERAEIKMRLSKKSEERSRKMKNKFFNSLAKSASKHSPEIYTAIAVAGLLSAVGATVYATIKSQKEVKKAEEKKGDSLDKKRLSKTCWKNYIPVVVLTILSAGCMCKSTSTSMKRTAALATLYNLSNTTLQEYKESVKEIVGDEKARKSARNRPDKKN